MSQPLSSAQQKLGHDLDRYLNKAIRRKETIKFKHIKIFLSGSSAAGKTNLRYSLLGQEFVEEYESTDIQETKHAYIANNTGILETKKGKIWSEFNLTEQLNLFKSLWESRLKKKSENNPYKSTDDTSSGTEESSEVRTKKIEKSSEVRTKISESKGMSEEIKIQEPVKLISMIDTGGQPGYIHMLPAIIHMLPDSKSCPVVNLIVMNMTKSLEDKVLVRYRKKGQEDEVKQYHLNYTNKDLIKLLLSVTTDSFNIQMTNTVNDGIIAFVGTCKDVLEKEEDDTKKILQLDEQLSTLVAQQECQDIIIKAPDYKYLYPISNKVPSDKVVIKLRDKIEHLLDDVDPMDIPINWMILELAIKLHCTSKSLPYISYKSFLDIAKLEASMEGEEEAKNALYYFHSRGILLNFQEVSKMSGYVIVEHQWLYDQLGLLVTVSPENSSCSNGVLLKNKLLRIEIKKYFESEGNIKMEDLISLLHVKKILAIYEQDKTEYCYFPFVLPYCQQYVDKFRFLLLEPLLIRFPSGFLPRGFFCSLVVHLLQDEPDGWSVLHGNTDKCFRNVMTFHSSSDDIYLRLQDKIYYLEIQVRHYAHCRGECMLRELKILCKYLYRVCDALQFDYKNLQFGFHCEHEKWDEEYHTPVVLLEPSLCNSGCCEQCKMQAVVLPFMNDPSSRSLVYCENCKKRMFCTTCKMTTDLGDLHKLWFKEIKVNI